MDNQLITTLSELWDSLTDEQKAKAQACTSLEELLALAGEEKIELPDELLDAAGGYIFYNEEAKAYEVVNDRDGHVMATVKEADYGGNFIEAKAAAIRKARELGQSTEGIQWYQLQSLRNPKDSSGC